MGVDEEEAESGQSSIGADSTLLRSPVVCKPFENAFEEVFKMAKINPQRTVKIINPLTWKLFHWLFIASYSIKVPLDLPFFLLNIGTVYYEYFSS